MDRKLPENPEIQRLIRLSEASRSCLESEVITLRHRLDVPARIRGSLKEHPSTWLFGSLASGLAASLMFRRKPAAVKKRRGIPGVLLGLTLTAARPLAKVWLADQLKHWVAGISPAQPAGSLQTRPSATSKSP
jgi:hypothetical protein